VGSLSLGVVVLGLVVVLLAHKQVLAICALLGAQRAANPVPAHKVQAKAVGDVSGERQGGRT